MKNRRNRLGPRFGEKMGRYCHAAITAAYRNQREVYDQAVANIYQMLDTVEQETWGQEEKANAANEVPETVVATEGEPASGPASKEKTTRPAPKRSKKASTKGKAKQQPRAVPKPRNTDSGE